MSLHALKDGPLSAQYHAYTQFSAPLYGIYLHHLYTFAIHNFVGRKFIYHTMRGLLRGRFVAFRSGYRA